MHWAIKVDKHCHIREKNWDSIHQLVRSSITWEECKRWGASQNPGKCNKKKVWENSRNAICRLLFARAFFASMHLSRDERQHLYFLPANSRMVRNSCITADTVLPRKGNRNCPGNTYTACLRPLGAEITFWQLFYPFLYLSSFESCDSAIASGLISFNVIGKFFTLSRRTRSLRGSGMREAQWRRQLFSPESA